MADDGGGVITRWLDQLDDKLRVEIETRLINWANVDKFIEAYTSAVALEAAGERFEELQDIRTIELRHGGAVYRILGSNFTVWEFVMLIWEKDENRRSKVGREVKQEAVRRLDILRAHPERRRAYKI